jgi:hypothetical protein
LVRKQNFQMNLKYIVLPSAMLAYQYLLALL